MNTQKNVSLFVSFLSISFFMACSHSPLSPFSPEREPAAAREAPTIPPQEGLAEKCSVDAAKTPSEIFLKYKAFLVSYNPLYRIPNWVSHEVYKDGLEHSCVKRGNGFKADERLKNDFHVEAVGSGDYAHTGFDRGHMAPSGDLQYSKGVNDESFYMTNMNPQTPGLNQKAWEALESRVRRWGCGNGHLKIVTGPVITDQIQRLNSCVSVAEKFFKVILSDKDGDFKAIGFIYDQTDTKDVWRERAMTVKQVEEITHHQFFTEFADETAEKFKNSIDLDAWEKSEVQCEKKCGAQNSRQGRASPGDSSEND